VNNDQRRRLAQIALYNALGWAGFAACAWLLNNTLR
jgi:hypothetical protein